jgi:magnesium-transporting ATPase (P-type)
LCNDANIKRSGEDSIFHVFGMPTEIALLIMGSKAGVYKEDFNERLNEIPFSS